MLASNGVGNSRKRVLVTGATGFIGRHSLSPLLDRGFEVHAVYKNKPLEEKNIHWHHADLLDETSVKQLCNEVQATHLLHFAWYVSPKDYKTSSENQKWIDASIKLLRSFKENGGTRAVLAGTGMEYDWTIAQDYLSENTSPLKPATLYGMAKNDARIASEEFARKNNLSLAWGRIFLLYGPNESPTRLVPYVINALLSEQPALCTSGEQIRDILYVQDVADAFVAVLNSDVTGTINIGSGKPIALKDVIYAIADIIGGRDLVRLGAKESPDDSPRLVFDVTRLKKEVGWRSQVTIEEGLRTTIEWWKTRRA
ncbi:MAG: NAD(P)-dependent oxidoreductase [bacterium]|nr:NAD(P)-dependent oxidoreductase [bacterium]